MVEIQYSGNRSRDMMLHGPLSNINLVPMGAFFGPNPEDRREVMDPARLRVPDERLPSDVELHRMSLLRPRQLLRITTR